MRDLKLGRPVGLVSGGSNPTGRSNRQTKSVGRGLMSNPDRLENIVVERENAGNQHFLFSEKLFPKPSYSGLLTHYQNSSWKSKSITQELFVKFGLTHYHTMPHFDALKIYRCGKLSKEEKLLVTSNFSFSHNVSYPTWHLFFILHAL